jgi:uncharacterized membrane protein
MCPTRHAAPALAALAAAVAAAAGLAGLAGCGPGSRTQAGGATDSLPPVAPVAVTTPTDTTFQRGLLRVRGDSLFFTGCGNTSESRLDDRTGIALAGAMTNLGAAQGQPIYVELNGGSPAGGGATFIAVEFLRATPVGEGGGCNRPPGDFVYQAFGTEPFWSVRVDVDSVVFTQPDEPNRVAWPAPAVVPAIDPSGARTWLAEGRHGGPGLTLVIERGSCADGMSGETTALRARATFGGRTLEGCARAGTAADEVR